MIDRIGDSPSSALAVSTPEASAPAGGFDAALKAAQTAAAKAEARQKDHEAIAEKGFSAWVRDTQMEQLKEKLKRKVMAEMGVDDESLAKLEPAMRQILEQKIEEEIQRRMAEEAKKDDGKKRQEDQAKTAQGGVACPVIPALAWPGGSSLF